MNHIRILLIMIGVTLVTAMLAMALMTWMSWRQATQTARREVQQTAERALGRAERSYSQALAVLRSLQQGHAEPCSPEHIRLMQSKVITTPSVDQIGYFHEGQLLCSSWGRPEVPVRWSAPHHITADGAAVQLDVQPRAAYGRRMLSLRLGNYDALMDPRHFVDLIAAQDMRLAIATPDGRLIARQPMPDSTLLDELLRQPRSGMVDNALFATARSEDWLAIVVAPRTPLRTIVQGQLASILPISALLALGAAGIAFWLSRRHLSLRGELAQAIRRKELHVVYQPIIELETGICVGAEALVRWQRRDGTDVRPDLFIPVAEESGLVETITDLVIERVVTDMRELLVNDRSAHIAINVAPEDMITGRALKVIADTLAGTGINNQQIWLEATERGFMDIERARAVISAARHAGHSVAIDDFGVGYSNLQYLQQLPLDALKIDKLFIEAIGTDSATSPVTGHIIDMAKTLGLLVVAEGVETEAQLAYLHGRQVEFGQGWLFSRALRRDAFIAYHQRRRELYGAARADMQNDRRH